MEAALHMLVGDSNGESAGETDCKSSGETDGDSADDLAGDSTGRFYRVILLTILLVTRRIHWQLLEIGEMLIDSNCTLNK